jgi:hypothetical protein
MSSPKEKANNLCVNFLMKPHTEELYYGINKELAKLCALIAVDEIILSRKHDGGFDDTLSSTGSEYYTPHPMYLTYWQQVKNEIEKL